MTISVSTTPKISGNTILCPNTTSQLSGTGTAASTNAWVSSETAVATISSSGLVTAKAFGTSVITYRNSFGCSNSTTINVSNPITPTFTQVPAVCTGSNLDALPTTSNNNIKGTWSPSLNNKATTTYTFTPSSGQCASTTSMTITVSSLPKITGNIILCPNSSSQLTGSPAAATTNPWSSSNTAVATISNTGLVNTFAKGTSIITYKAGLGCSNTAKITVTDPVTSVFTQVPAICLGDSLSALPLTSNNGVNGTWAPAINISKTTGYKFTPNPGQCAKTQTMTITVNPLPNVSLSVFNSVCDNAGKVNLSGGAPTGGTYSGPSVSNNSFNSFIGVGSYPITYSFTNNNGCSSSASQNLTVISCSTSSLEESEENGIILYPNPTSEAFIVESSLPFNGEAFVIHDVSGRVLSTGNLTGNKSSVHVSNLATGTYYLKILRTDQTLRFMKQ
jgi:hypothetical protein